MNDFFFDTEYFEDSAGHLQMISLGMVDQAGNELYCEADFDEQWIRDHPEAAWVRENVLPRLRLPKSQRMSIRDIARSIERFVGPTMALPRPRARPRFWTYFGERDWVLFCRCWGRMFDLPPGYPHHMMDVQQWWMMMGAPPALRPLKDRENSHNSLVDARWTKAFWRNLDAYYRRFVAEGDPS